MSSQIPSRGMIFVSFGVLLCRAKSFFTLFTKFGCSLANEPLTLWIYCTWPRFRGTFYPSTYSNARQIDLLFPKRRVASGRKVPKNYYYAGSLGFICFWVLRCFPFFHIFFLSFFFFLASVFFGFFPLTLFFTSLALHQRSRNYFATLITWSQFKDGTDADDKDERQLLIRGIWNGGWRELFISFPNVVDVSNALVCAGFWAFSNF